MESTAIMEMGNRIKTLRLAKSMTQEQLARALHVSAQAVSKWELGGSLPDIQLLPALSVVLGTSIDALFSLTDESRLARIDNMLEDRRFLTQHEFETEERFLQEKCMEGSENVRAVLLLARLYCKRAGEYRALASPLARRALACIFYGDMLCALRNQVAPYENEKGAADKMVDLWVQRLGRVLLAGKGFTSREMKHTFPLIAKDFKSIPVTRVPKVKVGVVGEIYVKYSPLGNNDLQKFLESQDCEVNFPGLMGFVQYCIFNMGEDHVLYGGKLAMKMGTDQLLNWLDSVERSMLKAEADAGFYAPGPFKELVEKPKGIISLGAKMGEGWLLTAEMIELVQGGYGNIVCAQPFGCLPNHIVGKGMVNKIRALYPSANITPIDYDPSATRVNQENRIKLMLAVAKERLNAPAEAKPLTAEEIAGGAPSLSHV